MPQETILFDRSCLRRKLDIRLADDASFLMVEPLVFGRATMGERLRHIDFRDDIRLTKGGSLIFADAIRLTGDASDLLGHAAVAKGAGAVVSLLYSAPDADLFLPLLRDLMPPGAGVLFARLLAKDSYLLRQTLIPMMTLLHGGPLPKTWTL
jgi:urease accessory protein